MSKSIAGSGPKQENLLIDLVDKSVSIETLSGSELYDFSVYAIQNIDQIQHKDVLFDCIKELVARFISEGYCENYYIKLSSIKGFIKNKIRSIDKNSSLRKLLNEIKKYIKYNLAISKDIEKTNHDYRYEIAEYFLEDEYCFTRILEEMPDIVCLADLHGCSLTYNVIRNYLEAYVLELNGKTSSVSKDKYAKIYRQLINSPMFDKQELNAIENLIEQFKEQVKSGQYKRHKYLEIVENIDSLALEAEKVETSTPNFNLDAVFAENENIIRSTTPHRIFDLSHEDTIVITSAWHHPKNYAYSVCKDGNGTHILKVHVTDVREFIKHDSELNDYLKYYMFYDHTYWMSPRTIRKLSLEPGEKKPVITFEFKVHPSGKIEAFKIYKSNIEVNDAYTMSEVDDLIKKHDRRFLPYVEVGYFLNHDMSKVNYGQSLTETFNAAVLNLVGSYFHNNGLPYIYKVQAEQNAQLYIKRMSDLSCLFGKIKDEDYKKFYHIICEDTNYAKYSYKCEGHASLNQAYYSDLLIPLYSYIGIHLQQLIHEFYFMPYSKETLATKKRIWENENQFIIKRANQTKATQRIEQHDEKVKKLGVKIKFNLKCSEVDD